jgi:hypothetical protein
MSCSRTRLSPPVGHLSALGFGKEENEDAGKIKDNNIAVVPKVGPEGHKVYQVQLRVCVQMMEGFRHTLHVTARWAPEFSGDAQKATEEDEEMDVDQGHGQDVNVSAVFSISSV